MAEKLIEHERIDALDKRVATARARAALAGAQLHVGEGDDGRPEWIVTRGAVTVALRALEDVEPWLERLSRASVLESAA